MERPRLRRRDPRRTGPIRNSGGAWREGKPWQDSEQPQGDAASGGVREGYRVIDEQIRRGRRMAQTLDEERRPRARHDERGGRREEGPGGFRFFAAQMRRTECLAQEILRQIGSARPNPWRVAELLFRLQIEAISDLARLGFGTLGMASPRWENSFERDVDRVTRDMDESLDEIEEAEEEELEDELWDWPAAPSAPTTVRSTVPIPVYVVSHERTEIDLDLPAGAQSLDLEVEPPLSAGTGRPPHPAFEAAFVALAYGPVILRIEVPRDLPAGRYRRRVLVRATGEPVGDLTVQAGTIPVVTVPPVAAVPKKARKR